MNRMIAVLIASILLAACAGDGAGKGSSSDIRKQAEDAIRAGTPSGAPTEESASYQNNISLILPKAGLAAGATQCFDVKVASFKDILAMQYTLRWDKSVLEFAGLKEFRLPYMSNENFGTTLAPEGKLTAVWIENSLKGISLPEGAAIYQVCFKAVGNPGQSTEISVSGNPTPIEVVTVGDKVWGIEAQKGKIAIQ